MKKIIFFIVIFFIILLCIFVFFVLPNRTAPPFTPTTNLPTPTIIPVKKNIPTLPPVNNLPILNKNALIDLLPYSTDNFNIEYLTTSDTFIVTIKNSPYEENKADANSWLKQHGVDDTAKLRIIYTRYRGVE